MVPPEERGLLRPGMTLYVIIWGNTAFHHSHLVNEWFSAQLYMIIQFFPSYSPFLNPIQKNRKHIQNLQYSTEHCIEHWTSYTVSTTTNTVIQTKDSFCLSITSLCWVRPEDFVHITDNILPCQAMGEKASGMLDPALTRLHTYITKSIACRRVSLVQGFQSQTFHRHAKKNSSIGLRKGKYAERKTFMNHWLMLNHSCIRTAWWKLTLSQTMT